MNLLARRIWLRISMWNECRWKVIMNGVWCRLEARHALELFTGLEVWREMTIMGAFDKLPRVDPDLPPVGSNSYDVIPGGSPRSPPSALLVERVTWGWPEVHDVTTRGWVVVRLALVRGDLNEHPGVDTGKLIKRTQCRLENACGKYLLRSCSFIWIGWGRSSSQHYGWWPCGTISKHHQETHVFRVRIIEKPHSMRSITLIFLANPILLTRNGNIYSKIKITFMVRYNKLPKSNTT